MWQSIEAEGAEMPSWSLIMKSVLPRILHDNESKTKKHPSSVVVTHGGEEGIIKNFENSMYQWSFNKKTGVKTQSFNGETCVYEIDRGA